MSKKSHKHENKKQKAKLESENNEINIDLSKIKQKTHKIITRTEKLSKNKYAKYAWITLLILTLILISSYVRLGPLNLPITDTWAQSTLENNIKNSIEQQVRTQNPQLPQASIDRMINEQYNTYYAQNENEINAQINQISNQYKSFLQNENGMTYLLGIDEYFFYSYAKWYDKNGYFGTDIVDGEPRFMLRKGRFGTPSRFMTHPFLIKTIKDIWQPINPDFNIEWSAFYIQVILIGLSSIPLFFLSKKISGTTGGFIAAALVLTATPLVGRTMGGSSDDDVHTILFTFSMLALLFTSIGRKTKTIAIMAVLAGLLNSIFMFTWSGWWYGFLLVLGSAGLYIIYEYARKRLEHKKVSKKEWIQNSTFFAVFLISAVIFAMLITAPVTNSTAGDSAMRVISSPANPLDLVIRLGSGADSNVNKGDYPLWPNVLRTVAELNSASFKQIISGAGNLPMGGAGIPFFYLSLAGIISLFFRYKENKNLPFYGLILLVWMIGMIFIATSAVRFILMASIPILLGVGAFVSLLLGPVAKRISKDLNIKKSVLTATLALILMLWLLWVPVSDARSASEGSIPIFDDTWYASMDAIREDTPSRAIISSWWDYGHFFQAYGNQSVTFDGADQGKRIYWMGKTLLTDEADEAHDILKVMNCGQEKPYDILHDHLNDSFRATQINFAIARMDRTDAKEYLENENISGEVIEELLGFTHCDDLYPMYFVTSEDMVGKAGVWAHFGGWNFTKSYFYYYLRHLPLPEVYELTEKNLNMSEDETRKLYNEAKLLRNEDAASEWISPFISYNTQEKVRCEESNETITCNYNIGLQQAGSEAVVLRRTITPLNKLEDMQIVLQVINTATGTATRQETIKPNKILIERDGEFEEQKFNDSEITMDVVIMDENGTYTSLITHPELSKSMFTRLFFMEGRGDDLDMFEKVSDKTSFRGERIIVWRVKP